MTKNLLQGWSKVKTHLKTDFKKRVAKLGSTRMHFSSALLGSNTALKSFWIKVFLQSSEIVFMDPKFQGFEKWEKFYSKISKIYFFVSVFFLN